MNYEKIISYIDIKELTRSASSYLYSFERDIRVLNKYADEIEKEDYQYNDTYTIQIRELYKNFSEEQEFNFFNDNFGAEITEIENRRDFFICFNRLETIIEGQNLKINEKDKKYIEVKLGLQYDSYDYENRSLYIVLKFKYSYSDLIKKEDIEDEIRKLNKTFSISRDESKDYFIVDFFCGKFNVPMLNDISEIILITNKYRKQYKYLYCYTDYLEGWIKFNLYEQEIDDDIKKIERFFY